MITIATTVIGMWLGTKSHPTPEDEHERVEEFFTDLEKPFEYDKKTDAGRVSPFRIIGLMILILGCVMAGIGILVLVLYSDNRAFALDLIIAVVMLFLGLIMRYRTS